jgi:hypothetical protein
LLHCLFQLPLVIVEEGMDLVVRIIADRVNLWTESLSGGSRILIEQRLDLVVVFLKQRPDVSAAPGSIPDPSSMI